MPYDIAALAGITPEERDLLTDELCAKSSLDWRDVEALRALATSKASQRVGLAAEKQTDGAGIEAFMDDITAQGWTPEIERRFIEKLERAISFTGALDRLYEIAEAYPVNPTDRSSDVGVSLRTLPACSDLPSSQPCRASCSLRPPLTRSPPARRTANSVVRRRHCRSPSRPHPLPNLPRRYRSQRRTQSSRRLPPTAI